LIDDPIFSIREIVIPWLLKGNKPDRYTTLKDKNSVEIYEGDIIEAFGGECINGFHEFVLKGPVIFQDGSFSVKNIKDNTYYDLKDANSYLYDLRVFGNIYENHELLEASE
jgi:uncharacterized phage protein (TIGR01671 family)